VRPFRVPRTHVLGYRLAPPVGAETGYAARLCLGDGAGGMVRYIREEVIAYEQSRRVSLVL